MRLYKSQDLWNIAVFILSDEENPFDCVSRAPDKRFTPQSLIRTRYHQITGYADPFLFANENDGYLYLFYEEERLRAKAPICAKRTKDLYHWENLGIVLKEHYHLSYPNVFSINGSIYMLPETHECNAVILYKSVDFPFRWERRRCWLKETVLRTVAFSFIMENGIYLRQHGMGGRVVFEFLFRMIS